MMTTYELSLVIDREPTIDELETVTSAQLDDAGLVATETDQGRVLAHLVADGDTLPAAIAAAVHAVESLGGLGLKVLGIDADDLVSVRDIAVRIGRTYESVRMLATGKRGPGGFPAPLSTGQWSLYSWAEVSEWLERHYGTAVEYDRALVAADHLIRARRILADGAHRDEMARLLVA